MEDNNIKEQILDYLEPTEEEVDVMVNNLAERVKDVVYAYAENRMRSLITECGLDKKVSLAANDTYTAQFNVEMVTGDFVQIIAKCRRNKSEVL
jgi:hypothetical protein